MKKSNHISPRSAARPRHDLIEQRRTDAAKRDSFWKKLTPAQQLAELDDRLGAGVGAAAQRKKIAKNLENIMIATQKNAKPEKQEVAQDAEIVTKQKGTRKKA